MEGLRCVLDTNVFVSALLLRNSLPFQAVKQASMSGVILRSDVTALELKQVLERKKFDKYISWEERQIFFSKFLIGSELVGIKESVMVCRDEKDNKFLELAVNGNADLIVTGDDDLLILHPFRTIKILTPQAFLTFADERLKNYGLE